MFKVQELLLSQFQEVRMLALVILVSKFNEQAQQSKGKPIYNNYLKPTEFINNWDWGDCFAGSIVGGYLFNRDRIPIIACLNHWIYGNVELESCPQSILSNKMIMWTYFRLPKSF